jgi:hypothetical protein
MLDLREPVFDEPAARAPDRPRAATPAAVSPLRAWSMWGGWSAIGVICAVTITSAASRVGRALAGGSTRAS